MNDNVKKIETNPDSCAMNTNSCAVSVETIEQETAQTDMYVSARHIVVPYGYDKKENSITVSCLKVEYDRLMFPANDVYCFVDQHGKHVALIDETELPITKCKVYEYNDNEVVTLHEVVRNEEGEVTEYSKTEYCNEVTPERPISSTVTKTCVQYIEGRQTYSFKETMSA